jgi:UDP-N-acetylmuramate--alanine ligase
LNAGTALAALLLAGVDRGPAEAALARFAGTGRRFEVSEAGGVTIVDDYAHHPSELAATIAAVREAYPGRRLRVLFQPHLYSRTLHLAAELGTALAGADDIVVTEIYPARETPVAGVSGKLIVDAISDRGRLVAWIPTVAGGAAYLADRVRQGDVVLVAGAGDVDVAPGLLRERLEAKEGGKA